MAEIKQRIVSCPNHHYYDANRYASCPSCNAGGFTPTEDPYACRFPASDENVKPPVNIPNIDNPNVTEPPAWDEVEQMGETGFVDFWDTASKGLPSPVVGWLVAISGPCRGTDYRIHTGYNYIGRLEGDVCINGDKTISHKRDSVVTFVPQTQKFYIAHEQGKNVLLVNDSPVIGGGKELNNYDTITIGMTKLKFIGFCGEHFQWKDEA